MTLRQVSNRGAGYARRLGRRLGGFDGARRSRTRIGSPSRALPALAVLCATGLAMLLSSAGAEARDRLREFDPFDILAWEILAGIEASGESASGGAAGESDQLRIAIRPFSIGQGTLPASVANEYNDKLLVSLLSQGGLRHRFIAREALGAIIREIDESSSRKSELENLLAALVESARADVLIVGKLRRTSDASAVLAYEAVRVQDGTILAATSHQRLELDPAEVDLAAKSEALEKRDAALRIDPDEGPDLAYGTPRQEVAPLFEEPRLVDPDPKVASIQAGLLKLGYDPGPVDGIFGSRTKAAIREYQLDNGLNVTGRPSAALTMSLRRKIAFDKANAGMPKPSSRALVGDGWKSRVYRSDGTYCREFQQNLRIGGKEESGYGKACLQSDGTWKIVK